MKAKLMKRLEALGVTDGEAQLLRELDAQLAALRKEAFRCLDGENPEDEEHEKAS